MKEQSKKNLAEYIEQQISIMGPIVHKRYRMLTKTINDKPELVVHTRKVLIESMPGLLQFPDLGEALEKALILKHKEKLNESCLNKDKEVLIETFVLTHIHFLKYPHKIMFLLHDVTPLVFRLYYNAVRDTNISYLDLIKLIRILQKQTLMFNPKK